MNSEQNNELEEIDYNNPESIEKPKKKRVSKKIIPLTIAESESKPLKESLVASDFAKQMDAYNKSKEIPLAPVKPKRVMSDAQKEALKLGRERKKLGLLSPPPPQSKIAEVIVPVVVKPLPPVVVKKTKSYRTMY